jgi:putative nucleotidyltransferase with HDIG domain
MINGKNKNNKDAYAFSGGRKTLWVWLIFILFSAYILSTSVITPYFDVSEGEISSEDVFYQGAVITYTSQIRTAAARVQAASQVEQIYIIDVAAVESVLSYLNTAFSSLLSVKSSLEGEEPLTLEYLKTQIPGDYAKDSFDAVMALSRDELLRIRDSLKVAVEEIMFAGVLKEEITAAENSIYDIIDAFGRSQEITVFLRAVFNASGFKANEEYDAIATAAELERVMQEVEPVQVTVQTGEKLIGRGSYITPEQVEALQALGMLSGEAQFLPYIGLLIFAAVICLFLAMYLKIFFPAIIRKTSNVVLISGVILFTLLLCKVISLLVISNEVEFASQIGYLLPVSLASILICVLFGQGLAGFVTVILAIWAAIIMGGQLNFFIAAFSGGMTGVLYHVYLRNRGQFVEASLYVGICNMVVITSLGIMSGQKYAVIGIGILLGFINGALSSILAVGLLPFIERVFGITTVMKLLELSNSNHPLLKRLMTEAPGTYHHSILVGNLAEAAAVEIKADPLIVRVGSYYHDIGKLRRPFFFVENQMGADNPHDKLQPTLSTLIITSHVKDGVEMLRANRLPQRVIDIAEQHHGTSTLQIFYHKALENAEDVSLVRKEDFSYPGPKPQSKEAALVMLADGVQAAVQSMVNPGKGHVEQKIREIIKHKTDEGQLQECPLTFRDLETIAQVFAKVLWGMHHTRIEYPDEVKEMGRR